ncbi:MAG TPA: c-type cytochrome [Gammaproteobacteria bacterium]|nr:c-type cytochrome [Gammaproteobacteria bacterium]
MKNNANGARRLAVALTALGAATLGLPALAGGELIKQGETTYNTYCSACHQPGGTGKEGVAPSLNSPEFLAMASDDFLHTTIGTGRPGTAMVAWDATLGKDKIDAVIAYLRSLYGNDAGSLATTVNAEPPAKGDPAVGAERYKNICSGCHADQGGGYLAGGSAPAIGKPGFLKVASDGYIRQTVRYGRSNTRMRGFQGPTGLANLSDKEIDDIISYLRSLNR